MNLKEIVFFAVLTILFICTDRSTAQEVKILQQSDFKTNEQVDIFKCITELKDTTHGHYMATLQIKMANNENSLTNAFVAIRAFAMKMNANGFVVKRYQKTENSNRILELDVYYFEDTKNIVRSAYQNQVYIFCDDRDNDKNFDVKVNDEKISFKSGTYLHYETKPEKSLQLNKDGGKLKYEKDKLPVFLSLTSMALEPNQSPGAITISAGGLTPINANFGYLLIQCLKKAEKE